jgi:hypothetical protein
METGLFFGRKSNCSFSINHTHGLTGNIATGAPTTNHWPFALSVIFDYAVRTKASRREVVNVSEPLVIDTRCRPDASFWDQKHCG